MSRRRLNSATIACTEASDRGESASIAAIWVNAAAHELLLIISVSNFCASGSGATAKPRRQPHIAYALLSPSERSEEHTSELQSQSNLVCRLLLEKKKKTKVIPLPRHTRRYRKRIWMLCAV